MVAAGEPSRQRQSIGEDGRQIRSLIEGVRERAIITHQDERGTLAELFSESWAFDELPMVHTYIVTVRYGQIKGWACHEHQVDRYVFIGGTVRLVLFDARPASPTHRNVMEMVYSELNRTLVSVPPGVYHAVQGISHEDGLMFNFPSRAYDRTAPDKLVLPIGTPEIPYVFKHPGPPL